MKNLAVVLIAFLTLTSFKGEDRQTTGPYKIQIDKNKLELRVYDSEGWYATYPVVFGKGGLEDKMFEGDNKTPNGSFTVLSKKTHVKYGKFLLLSYPTPEDEAKFKKRKAEGKISKKAKIGGGIAIHGTWKGEDWAVDGYQNWTDGCISLKNPDAEDLYSYIPVGTEVEIIPLTAAKPAA